MPLTEVQPVKTRTFSEEVAERLREAIRNGSLGAGSRLVEHGGAMLGRERHDPRVKIRDGFLDRREREATARHIAGAKHAVASRTNGGDARQR